MQPYDDYRPSQSNVRARLSVLLGLIGIVLAPAAVYLDQKFDQVTLIIAVISIAVGCSLFGIVALVLSRKARRRRSVSLGRMGGAKLCGLGRVLGTLSLGLGLGACIALGVYVVMASR